MFSLLDSEVINCNGKPDDLCITTLSLYRLHSDYVSPHPPNELYSDPFNLLSIIFTF